MRRQHILPIGPQQEHLAQAACILTDCEEGDDRKQSHYTHGAEDGLQQQSVRSKERLDEVRKIHWQVAMRRESRTYAPFSPTAVHLR